MPIHKTPGVYLQEINAQPPVVAQVETAIPAFVGHTATAIDQGQSLALKPTRIASLLDYVRCFGQAAVPRFTLTFAGQRPVLTQADGPAGGRYTLYQHLQLYFDNGGGPCDIVSVGSHAEPLTAAAFMRGIDALPQASEPTLLLVPEAVLLDEAACAQVQRHMVVHCGEHMRSRMAVLDVWQGWRPRSGDGPDPVHACREAWQDNMGAAAQPALSPQALSYAAAYYPWLNTTVWPDRALSWSNIDAPAGFTIDADTQAAVLTEATRLLNLLPPCAAVAGVMASVDRASGVWQAPANVSLNRVVSPAVSISNAQQEDLNVPADGLAINAIRTFQGQGVQVWGARTLAGNDPEWRYVSVRRFMLMVEQSIKQALNAFTFEPNDANTWLRVRQTVENFLNTLWQQGALVGSKPAEAFAVEIGLGSTMTPDDVINGQLRLQVVLAPARPSEFLVLVFEQSMQA